MLEQATYILFGFFAGWGFRGMVDTVISGWHGEAFRRNKLRLEELRRQREERAEGAL